MANVAIEHIDDTGAPLYFFLKLFSAHYNEKIQGIPPQG